MIEMNTHAKIQHNHPNILGLRAFSNLHDTFTRQQCGCHGNQWPKPIFATLLHLPTKFGAHRSVNSGEEGCENFPMISW